MLSQQPCLDWLKDLFSKDLGILSVSAYPRQALEAVVTRLFSKLFFTGSLQNGLTTVMKIKAFVWVLYVHLTALNNSMKTVQPHYNTLSVNGQF